MSYGPRRPPDYWKRHARREVSSGKVSTHVGELVAQWICQQHGVSVNRSHIEKVTITLPDGKTMDLPVGTRVDVEHSRTHGG
jgi:hypothetical protein